MDESGHLALVNAGTRILLSKEVGEEERGTVDRRSGDDATAVDVLRGGYEAPFLVRPGRLPLWQDLRP